MNRTKQDLAVTHKALREIVTILNATQADNIFYEVGRATMIARLALAESGDLSLKETRLNICENCGLTVCECRTGNEGDLGV